MKDSTWNFKTDAEKKYTSNPPAYDAISKEPSSFGMNEIHRPINVKVEYLEYYFLEQDGYKDLSEGRGIDHLSFFIDFIWRVS